MTSCLHLGIGVGIDGEEPTGAGAGRVRKLNNVSINQKYLLTSADDMRSKQQQAEKPYKRASSIVIYGGKPGFCG